MILKTASSQITPNILRLEGVLLSKIREALPKYFIPLQFCKVGDTPLQFVYLENCHYNFISPSSIPFSTSLVYMDPLTVTNAYEEDV
jgi:hypothetical protein